MKRMCMLTLCVLVLSSMILAYPFTQSSQKENFYSGGEGQKGQVWLFFNPIGLFQFGPVVGAEFFIKPATSVSAHLRYTSLGHYKPWRKMGGANMALGLGVSHHINVTKIWKKIMNPFTENDQYFAGLVTELGWGTFKNPPSQDEWGQYEGNESTLSLFGNLGYKWNFNPEFFIRVGSWFGYYFILSEKLNWIGIDWVTEFDPYNWFVFLWEVSIGWGVKK